MSYSSDSPADRLASVRAAIERVMNSQAYSIGNRNVQYAQLGPLMKLEERLMREVQESGNNGQMASLGRMQDLT